MTTRQAFRMKALALLLAVPLAAMASPPSPETLTGSLDTLIAARFKPELPGVAALVLKEGKPVLRKGYGTVNVELGVPARPEHVFRIGSTTKLLRPPPPCCWRTKGSLRSTPLWRATCPMRRRSGARSASSTYSPIPAAFQICRWIPATGARRRGWTTPRRNLVAPLRGHPLDFEPGSTFTYNNTGYNLLGLVIEKLSRQGCYEFIDARIARPLGLKHTAAGDDRRLIPRPSHRLPAGSKAGLAPRR